MILPIKEKNNFLDLDQAFSSYDNSSIAIIPAGFEYSVSWGKNTSYGPDDIIKSSAYVEFFDEELQKELCFDKGIVTLENMNFHDKNPLQALDLIKRYTEKCLDDGKYVVTLGGEHTIAIAPIAAHYHKYPDMSILQFDAHSDLRQSYQDSEYSHASAMARVCDFFPPERITQVGIRALCKEEYDLINKYNIKTFYASSIRNGLYGDQWQKAVTDTLSNNIYITFDVDFFDPSIIPATGTPEPNGFLYHETLNVFREISKANKNIIGFDIVEYAPIDNLHHAGLTIARLIYKILNFAFYKYLLF